MLIPIVGCLFRCMSSEFGMWLDAGEVTHASLNRHDLFTLQGISGHPEAITYPIILAMTQPVR